MKPASLPAINDVNQLLLALRAGDHTISGRLDVYNVKFENLEMLDKQLTRKADRLDFTHDENSPAAYSPASPFGGSPLTWDDSGTGKRTFLLLVNVLNSSFPDYDFSSLQPSSFLREPSTDMVINSVNLSLKSALSNEQLADMWRAIDAAIGTHSSEIFSFNDTDSGLDEHKLWSINLFFVNRKLKRVLFFNCSAERDCGDGDGDGEAGAEDEEVDDDGYGAGASGSRGRAHAKNAEHYYSRIEGRKNVGFHFNVRDDEDAFDVQYWDDDDDDTF